MAWSLYPSDCPSSLNVTDSVLLKLFVPAGKKSLSSPVPVLAFEIADAAIFAEVPLLLLTLPPVLILQLKFLFF